MNPAPPVTSILIGDCAKKGERDFIISNPEGTEAHGISKNGLAGRFEGRI
jgi:hypothetical protein